MKLIKFVKPHSPYAIDDVAGIPDKEAEALIEDGVAVEYTKKDKGEKEETKTDEADNSEVKTENLDQPVEDKMVKSPATKK